MRRKKQLDKQDHTGSEKKDFFWLQHFHLNCMTKFTDFSLVFIYVYVYAIVYAHASVYVHVFLHVFVHVYDQM